MDAENVKPDLDMVAWVELFGHTSFAARVKSSPVGSAMFIRCDVLDGKGGVAFSRYVNPSAVYSMSPIEEAHGQDIMSQRGGAGEPTPHVYIRALPEPAAEVHREEREEREGQEADSGGVPALIIGGDEVDIPL